MARGVAGVTCMNCGNIILSPLPWTGGDFSDTLVPVFLEGAPRASKCLGQPAKNA